MYENDILDITQLRVYFEGLFTTLNIFSSLCFSNIVYTNSIVLRPKAALVLSTSRVNEEWRINKE